MASISYKSIPVSLELVVLCYYENELYFLTHKSEGKSGKSKILLPTGVVKETDDIEKSIQKTLSSLKGVKVRSVIKSSYYADLNRFPKKRVIGLTNIILTESSSVLNADNISNSWISVSKFNTLGLDHKEIVKDALTLIKEKSFTTPILFDLLPVKFTLTHLQNLYELVWNKSLDKRNFRKKLLSTNIVKPLNQFEKGVAHKAAQLYSLSNKGFQNHIAGGEIFSF